MTDSRIAPERVERIANRMEGQFGVTVELALDLLDERKSHAETQAAFAETVRALAGCVAGMNEWAAQEDGIPDFPSSKTNPWAMVEAARALLSTERARKVLEP
jgi:hypothetical protein